jgi:hypothetical protein
MDLSNEITDMEDIIMINPLDEKKSTQKCKDNAIEYDFFSQVYPDHIIARVVAAALSEGKITPPKCIFKPSKELIRTMIRINIKYSKTDTLPRFLLRMGLLKDPNWYLKSATL